MSRCGKHFRREERSKSHARDRGRGRPFLSRAAATPALSASCALSHFIQVLFLGGGHHYYLHFAEGELEAPRELCNLQR